MANYVKHESDENKYQCPDCDYGCGEGNGKSRQGVSNHFKRNHIKETEESPSDPLLEVPISETSDEEPEWLKFSIDDSEEDSATVSVSPLASTLLRGMVSDEEPPKSPKALREYYKQQGKMMRWIFSGFIDPMFSWWGRGTTGDDKFSIKRSSSDWELFEDASSNWLEYRGMSIPLNPDMIMVGTIASFYIPVVSQVHSKRDPNRMTFLKKWRARRALKKALKREQKEMEA